MKKIEAFQTTDGKLFSTTAEATEHQDYLDAKPEIEAFINSKFCKYNNQAHRKIVETTIIAWKKWKAN